MTKIGDKICCISKHTDTLTYNKVYTVLLVLNSKEDANFFSSPYEYLIHNDLGVGMLVESNLFESYEVWLPKFREEQIKSIIDD
jgi:hypothetical protein